MASPTVDRRLGLVGNVAFKAPVKVMSAGNITLSGEQTIDGVAVKSVNLAGIPDRVLVNGQTDQTKDGIWDVSTAAWTRSLDADGNYDLRKGTSVLVTDGTTYGGSYWQLTAEDPVTVGTSHLTWTRSLTGSLSSLTFIQAGTGAVVRNAQDKMREWLTVQDFGAVGDGITDDTVAFQNAAATGRTVRIQAGTYLIKRGINCATKGQMFFGDGQFRSIIRINSTFTLADTGAPFYATCGEEGPIFRDFAVELTQPDTAVRANLVAYPPAFYLVDTPRFQMDNVRIACAKTAIKMTGNSGGAFLRNLEISAFDIHLEIDGSLDSVRLINIHCWNFGVGGSQMTANQQIIYRDGNNMGLKVGTADDLIMDGVLFICDGPQMYMHAGTAGFGPFGTATNCDFDTDAGLVCDIGQMTFSSCVFTSAKSSRQFLVQKFGWLKFVNCEFEAAAQQTGIMMEMIAQTNTLASSPMLQITNCLFRLGLDMTVVSCASTTGSAHLQFINNGIYNAPDVAFTKPMIWVKSGGRATIIGNRITDKGTGAGVFIQVDVDDQHIITNNSFTGWSSSFPAGPTIGTYSGNLGLPDAFVSGQLQGVKRVLRLTGTLTGAGTVTKAHGLGSAQLKVLHANAYYTNAALGATPLTISSIDGTNIFLTGGTTTLPTYRATITYTDSLQSPWTSS